MNMHKSSVAVLGLGIMGIAMAENLDKAGFLAATWNRNPKPDAPKFNSSIEAVISASKFILVLVTNDEAATEVINNMKPLLTADHVVIQCSTVNPDTNKKLAQTVEATGAGFIEALIGGSKPAAINRTIIFYTGGKKSLVDLAEPVLLSMAAQAIYIGDVGQASAIKLAMNLSIALQVESLCESFAYAESNGISADVYFHVLKSNTAWNRLTDVKEPKLRDQDFSPQFSVRNMLKDVRLALATDGTRNGLTLLSAVEKIYADADNKGMGDDDMISLYKLL